MRRAAFFTMALCGTALGQGLLDCIEPDVLRALLLQSQGERPPVITAAVPAELSALRMPREFTWIGSAERITGRVDASTNAAQVTAAWRSNLAPDAARAAASAALTASGWEVRPMPGAGLTVFNSVVTPVSQPACRGGSPVNFAATAMEGVTYLTITLQRGNDGNALCNQLVRPGLATGSELAEYMPRLAAPVDPDTGTVARMQGGGGGFSGLTQHARAEFNLRDSAASVARHFARQMTEQGWSSDASWSGTSTAGSTWSKRAGGGLILGALSVTAVDERRITATLRVSRLQ